MISLTEYNKYFDSVHMNTWSLVQNIHRPRGNVITTAADLVTWTKLSVEWELGSEFLISDIWAFTRVLTAERHGTRTSETKNVD